MEFKEELLKKLNYHFDKVVIDEDYERYNTTTFNIYVHQQQRGFKLQLKLDFDRLINSYVQYGHLIDEIVTNFIAEMRKVLGEHLKFKNLPVPLIVA